RFLNFRTVIKQRRSQRIILLERLYTLRSHWVLSSFCKSFFHSRDDFERTVLKPLLKEIDLLVVIPEARRLLLKVTTKTSQQTAHILHELLRCDTTLGKIEEHFALLLLKFTSSLSSSSTNLVSHQSSTSIEQQFSSSDIVVILSEVNVKFLFESA